MEAWRSVVNLTLLNEMDKYARENFSDSFIEMVWNDTIKPSQAYSSEFNRFMISVSLELFKNLCLAFCTGMFDEKIQELRTNLAGD